MSTHDAAVLASNPHRLAPQPAADTETEVQWGVRYPGGQVVTIPGGEPSRDYVDTAHDHGFTIVRCTATYTRWEEA